MPGGIISLIWGVLDKKSSSPIGLAEYPHVDSDPSTHIRQIFTESASNLGGALNSSSLSYQLNRYSPTKEELITEAVNRGIPPDEVQDYIQNNYIALSGSVAQRKIVQEASNNLFNELCKVPEISNWINGENATRVGKQQFNEMVATVFASVISELGVDKQFEPPVLGNYTGSQLTPGDQARGYQPNNTGRGPDSGGIFNYAGINIAEDPNKKDENTSSLRDLPKELLTPLANILQGILPTQSNSSTQNSTGSGNGSNSNNNINNVGVGSSGEQLFSTNITPNVLLHDNETRSLVRLERVPEGYEYIDLNGQKQTVDDIHPVYRAVPVRDNLNVDSAGHPIPTEDIANALASGAKVAITPGDYIGTMVTNLVNVKVSNQFGKVPIRSIRDRINQQIDPSGVVVIEKVKEINKFVEKYSNDIASRSSGIGNEIANIGNNIQALELSYNNELAATCPANAPDPDAWNRTHSANLDDLFTKLNNNRSIRAELVGREDALKAVASIDLTHDQDLNAAIHYTTGRPVGQVPGDPQQMPSNFLLYLGMRGVVHPFGGDAGFEGENRMNRISISRKQQKIEISAYLTQEATANALNRLTYDPRVSREMAEEITKRVSKIGFNNNIDINAVAASLNNKGGLDDSQIANAIKVVVAGKVQKHSSPFQGGGTNIDVCIKSINGTAQDSIIIRRNLQSETIRVKERLHELQVAKQGYLNNIMKLVVQYDRSSSFSLDRRIQELDRMHSVGNTIPPVRSRILSRFQAFTEWSNSSSERLLIRDSITRQLEIYLSHSNAVRVANNILRGSRRGEYVLLNIPVVARDPNGNPIYENIRHVSHAFNPNNYQDLNDFYVRLEEALQVELSRSGRWQNLIATGMQAEQTENILKRINDGIAKDPFSTDNLVRTALYGVALNGVIGAGIPMPGLFLIASVAGSIIGITQNLIPDNVNALRMLRYGIDPLNIMGRSKARNAGLFAPYNAHNSAWGLYNHYFVPKGEAVSRLIKRISWESFLGAAGLYVRSTEGSHLVWRFSDDRYRPGEIGFRALSRLLGLRAGIHENAPVYGNSILSRIRRLFTVRAIPNNDLLNNNVLNLAQLSWFNRFVYLFGSKTLDRENRRRRGDLSLVDSISPLFSFVASVVLSSLGATFTEFGTKILESSREYLSNLDGLRYWYNQRLVDIKNFSDAITKGDGLLSMVGREGYIRGIFDGWTDGRHLFVAAKAAATALRGVGIATHTSWEVLKAGINGGLWAIPTYLITQNSTLALSVFFTRTIFYSLRNYPKDIFYTIGRDGSLNASGSVKTLLEGQIRPNDSIFYRAWSNFNKRVIEYVSAPVAKVLSVRALSVALDHTDYITRAFEFNDYPRYFIRSDAIENLRHLNSDIFNSPTTNVNGLRYISLDSASQSRFLSFVESIKNGDITLSGLTQTSTLYTLIHADNPDLVRIFHEMVQEHVNGGIDLARTLSDEERGLLTNYADIVNHINNLSTSERIFLELYSRMKLGLQNSIERWLKEVSREDPTMTNEQLATSELRRLTPDHRLFNAIHDALRNPDNSFGVALSKVSSYRFMDFPMSVGDLLDTGVNAASILAVLWGINHQLAAGVAAAYIAVRLGGVAINKYLPQVIRDAFDRASGTYKYIMENGVSSVVRASTNVMNFYFGAYLSANHPYGEIYPLIHGFNDIGKGFGELSKGVHELFTNGIDANSLTTIGAGLYNILIGGFNVIGIGMYARVVADMFGAILTAVGVTDPLAVLPILAVYFGIDIATNGAISGFIMDMTGKIAMWVWNNFLSHALSWAFSGGFGIMAFTIGGAIIGGGIGLFFGPLGTLLGAGIGGAIGFGLSFTPLYGWVRGLVMGFIANILAVAGVISFLISFFFLLRRNDPMSVMFGILMMGFSVAAFAGLGGILGANPAPQQIGTVQYGALSGGCPFALSYNGVQYSASNPGEACSAGNSNNLVSSLPEHVSQLSTDLVPVSGNSNDVFSPFNGYIIYAVDGANSSATSGGEITIMLSPEALGLDQNQKSQNGFFTSDVDITYYHVEPSKAVLDAYNSYMGNDANSDGEGIINANAYYSGSPLIVTKSGPAIGRIDLQSDVKNFKVPASHQTWTGPHLNTYMSYMSVSLNSNNEYKYSKVYYKGSGANQDIYCPAFNSYTQLNECFSSNNTSASTTNVGCASLPVNEYLRTGVYVCSSSGGVIDTNPTANPSTCTDPSTGSSYTNSSLYKYISKVGDAFNVDPALLAAELEYNGTYISTGNSNQYGVCSYVSQYKQSPTTDYIGSNLQSVDEVLNNSTSSIRVGPMGIFYADSSKSSQITSQGTNDVQAVNDASVISDIEGCSGVSKNLDLNNLQDSIVAAAGVFAYINNGFKWSNTLCPNYTKKTLTTSINSYQAESLAQEYVCRQNSQKYPDCGILESKSVMSFFNYFSNICGI